MRSGYRRERDGVAYRQQYTVWIRVQGSASFLEFSLSFHLFSAVYTVAFMCVCKTRERSCLFRGKSGVRSVAGEKKGGLYLIT